MSQDKKNLQQIFFQICGKNLVNIWPKNDFFLYIFQNFRECMGVGKLNSDLVGLVKILVGWTLIFGQSNQKMMRIESTKFLVSGTKFLVRATKFLVRPTKKWWELRQPNFWSAVPNFWLALPNFWSGQPKNDENWGNQIFGQRYQIFG